MDACAIANRVLGSCFSLPLRGFKAQKPLYQFCVRLRFIHVGAIHVNTARLRQS